MRPARTRPARIPARIHIVAVALAATVLAAVAAQPSPREATAQPYTPECSAVVSNGVILGFGTHACQNLGPDYYEITSFFARIVPPGPGTSCDVSTGTCRQTTSVTCRRDSRRARCATPSGNPQWNHTSSNSTGPYNDRIQSTVTLGCAPGRHVNTLTRYNASCHSHSFTPPPSFTCGTWHPHDNAPTGGGVDVVRPGSRPSRPPHVRVVLEPCVVSPNPNPNPSPSPNPDPPPDPDPDPDPFSNPDICNTGVAAAITGSQQQAWAGDLWWETLVTTSAPGEPGEPWPPHPDVPGASSWLVVSESPVWPVVDPGVADMPWEATGEDGCSWLAVAVQARLQQLLPWQAADRQIIEATDRTRPEAGLGVYLQRWDNLGADRQAEVIANQPHHDFTSPDCELAVAAVGADSQAQCRWELPEPGVWHWQALACFDADTGEDRVSDCAPLASGVAWFKPITAYTQGITLDTARAGVARARAGPGTGVR